MPICRPAPTFWRWSCRRRGLRLVISSPSACRAAQSFIIAMLAVLKVGAAFLPVDPTYPAAVIAHMLQDSGTRLGIGGPDYGTVTGPDTGSNKGKSVHRHDCRPDPGGAGLGGP
ncbi:AMP-binding protein [Phaeobacter inhibens]|uniref:AMP-binding protein n=1 Tax=Phaeobacter inhibens TaxID=221822 RepID=UPI0028830A4A|nr:AMP-binding protein [Phaeobacter inhibens]